MILVNGKEINSFVFNGGECHVKLKDKGVSDDATTYLKSDITAYLYDSDDIMKLLLTVDAIRQYYPSIVIKLKIPYFPYARQDRVCVPGEAFSLKVMADLINNMKVNEVTIYDPHSKMTGSLLNNIESEVKVKTVEDIFKETGMRQNINENMVLVSPDEGAEKRVREVAAGWDNKEIIYCKKARDLETGNITSTEIIGEVDITKHYLIIDDICDGGRTFIELAKKFQEKGLPKENLSLYVTHGIFSRGLDTLETYFNRIYCYHVFPPYIGSQEKDILTILGD